MAIQRQLLKQPTFTEQCEEKANDLFQRVVSLAYNGNKQALEELSKSTNLDIHQGVFTPIAYLAFHAKAANKQDAYFQAVKLLLRLGAKVEDALFGFAASNQLHLGSSFLSQIHSRACIIQGFAYMGHNEAALKDIKQYDCREEVYLAAAAGNNQELIHRFRFHKFSKSLLIKGAAISGNLQPYEDEEHTDENVIAALEGCLLGCHYTLAEKILTSHLIDFKHRHEILHAYIQGGGTDHLFHFMLNHSAIWILAFALAKAGRHEDLARLIKKYPDMYHNITLNAAQGYLEGNFLEKPTTAFRLFAMIKDKQLRHTIADHIDLGRIQGTFMTFDLGPIVKLADDFHIRCELKLYRKKQQTTTENSTIRMKAKL